MSDFRDASGRWRPTTFFSHKVESVRAFDILNERGGIAVEFHAVKGGRPSLDLEGGQSIALSVWLTRSTSGFVTRPVVEADVVTIRFITNGRMVRRYRSRDEVVGEGFATFSAFEDLRSAEASAGFSTLSATITRSTLLARHRLLEAAPETQLPHFEPIVPIDTVAMRSLYQGVSRIQQHLKLIDQDHDLFFPLFEEIVAYQVLSNWPRRGDFAGPRNCDAPAACVRRAVDYIDAHLGEPIRLADVSQAAGVSVRVLQHALKRELGTTPFGFILTRRLERVRDELQQDTNRDLTIAQLARRWGFVHMSDFASRYRKAFGCAPSETRRSSQ